MDQAQGGHLGIDNALAGRGLHQVSTRFELAVVLQFECHGF
jgi:hypothetical protein